MSNTMYLMYFLACSCEFRVIVQAFYRQKSVNLLLIAKERFNGFGARDMSSITYQKSPKNWVGEVDEKQFF